MRSPGINGEGELRGQPANTLQVHLEKWPLERSVCVCILLAFYHAIASYCIRYSAWRCGADDDKL